MMDNKDVHRLVEGHYEDRAQVFSVLSLLCR